MRKGIPEKPLGVCYIDSRVRGMRYSLVKREEIAA
jgi:hypothetical protein